MSCTICYDPDASQADHLRNLVRFKGFVLEAGKDYEVTDELAGQALAADEINSYLKLRSGTPAKFNPVPAGVKQASKDARERLKRFVGDPAGALDGFPVIESKLLGELRTQKKAADAISKGSADEQLAEVAIWARLSGREDVSRAAAARAHQLDSQE